MLFAQKCFRIAAIFCFATLFTNAPMPPQAYGQQVADDEVPDLLKLEGKVVEVIFADGHAQWPLKIVQLEEGKTPGTLKYIKVQFKEEQKFRKINANKIADIVLDHEHLDVEFDRGKRGLVHSPEKRQLRLAHLAEVKQRLKGTGRRLWKPLTADQEAKFLADQKELVEKVKSHFSRLNFRVVETEFFIVCTDLSAAQINGYLASLDAMYRELCIAFGIPPAKNIWCGKCVVFPFSREAEFMEFEAAFFDNPNTDGAQGLCHQSGNGQVVFSGFRGNSDSYFGGVMVHETAHGFVHRYLSSARAPSWLNEGMSDWIANAIMKTDSVARKQINSANIVKRSGTWGDFLTTSRIDFDYYGSASTLVELLLRRDKGGQFRAFFTGIKEGKAAEESLKESFGISYQDLIILYAEQIARMPEKLPRRR